MGVAVRQEIGVTIFYKINNGLLHLMSNHIPQRNEIGANLRNRDDSTPFIRTERYENSFYPYAIKRWNDLGEDYKFKPSVQSFTKHLYDTPWVFPFRNTLPIDNNDVWAYQWKMLFQCTLRHFAEFRYSGSTYL